jgi:hypothetical protein
LLHRFASRGAKHSPTWATSYPSAASGRDGEGSNTSGILYFDDFVSRRFTYIGMVPDPGVPDIAVINQAGWMEKEYTYSSTIPHAVVAVSSSPSGTSQLSASSYEYDENGNMTCRVEDGVTYLQVYNAENRISSITRLAGGDCTTPGLYDLTWDFVYDGDGVRTVTATTAYIARSARVFPLRGRCAQPLPRAHP